MKKTTGQARPLRASGFAGRRLGAEIRPGDVSALRKAAASGEDDISLLIQIAGETGARLSELTDARWAQFGLVNGAPTWTFVSNKCGGPPRALALSPTAIRAIESLASKANLASQHVFPQFVSPRVATNRYRLFAERHGLGHVRFHDIRMDWMARTGGK